MSNTKYALRANTFGYNDEYYNLYDGSTDGRICGIYETREAAMDAWKKMEHQTVKNQPLGSVLFYRQGDLGALSEEEALALDNFVFARCGEHIWHDEYVDEECETTIARMNVEDVFEFLTKAELCSYTLVEYQQTNAKFYVWWLPEKENYIFSDEGMGGSGGVCQANSVEKLYADYGWFLEYTLDKCEGDYYHFTGALNGLSHSPEILRTLIATDPKIQYDEAQQTLSLQDNSVFKLVYPLLINPTIEVREVTIEQIMEIEKNLPERVY
ncbi:MAG: hypothetical protein PHR16_07755 [Methylovulum sp.]|nr:hypothetical protein [Methylovulum sp.]